MEIASQFATVAGKQVHYLVTGPQNDQALLLDDGPGVVRLDDARRDMAGEIAKLIAGRE